jgi:hypothetical protein
MQDVLSARPIRIERTDYGYLRVWTFDVEDDDPFLQEVVRLFDLLPQNGLIIDLRSNPGGFSWAAERMLQLLTPEIVSPTRFSLLTSPMTRSMARSAFNRLGTAADHRACLVQRHRPVLERSCAVRGRCNTYSSRDLFAAGFADRHRSGDLCRRSDRCGRRERVDKR